MNIRSRVRVLRLAVLSAIVLTSGCTDNGSDVQIQFANYLGPAALQDPSSLRVDLDVGGIAYHLTGSDFTTQEFGTLHSKSLSIPGTGELRVFVALVTAPADTLGQLTVSIPLQSRFHYGVMVLPGGARPAGICVGQIAQAPVRRPGSVTATDTLWVAYAGLPEGAIC
jgi:hypothetical protein